MTYVPGQNYQVKAVKSPEGRAGDLESALITDEVEDSLAEYTAAGPIAPYGTAILLGGAARAMTLQQPIAGPKPAGQDGNDLTIIAGDAFAYTVTTAANGIHGSKHVATFTAGVGNCISLTAFNGVWYTNGTPQGVALS